MTIAQHTPQILKNWTQGVFYILAFFYTDKFTNEERRRNMTYVAAQDVKQDFRFHPQPLLSLTSVFHLHSLSASSKVRTRSARAQ
jgi:hypothetical protein